MSLNQEQVQLLSVLSNSLSEQHALRTAAEAQLATYASGYAGFASLLLSLLPASMANLVGGPQCQQMASILLKQYVVKHWSEAHDAFEAPVVQDEEKVRVYGALLPLLVTPDHRLRKQVSAIITEIAENDFPERWPSLLPDVLNILGQAAHTSGESIEQQNLLNGTMEVLVEFCETMTDEQLTSTIPQLFPTLLGLSQKKMEIIMSVQRVSPLPQMTDAQKQSVQDALQFCIYSLRIYQSCCYSLLAMNELSNHEARGKAAKGKKTSDFNRVLNDFLLPSLQQWYSYLSSVLQMPQGSGVFDFAVAFPVSWGLRLEAVKALVNLGEKFEKSVMARGLEGSKLYQSIMHTLLDTMTNLYPMYERRVLHARTEDEDDGADSGEFADGEEDDAFDEDGNAITMSAFLYEAFQYFKHVLQMQPPKKTAAKKAAAKKGAAAAAPAADLAQTAWAHLKSLFATGSESILPRLLQLSLQYGQLSSREIAASLGAVEEFLSFQQDEDFTAEKINVRNGVKDLLLDCILFNANSDEAENEDMAELRAMGMDFGGGGGTGEGTGSALLDRAVVLHTLCPLLTNLLQHSMALRNRQPQPDRHWWKGRELATLLVAHIVHDITEMSQPQQPTKGKKKAAAVVTGPVPFNLQSFVSDILLPDLAVSAAGSHPLLRTQALSSTSKFAPVFVRAKESTLVFAVLEALVVNMAVPTPDPAGSTSLLVRIAAVNAFGTLCSTIDQQLLMHNNILPVALTNICQLVHSASTPDADGTFAVEESALLKVLETLMMAINVDQPTTIAAEPTITPLLLSAWSANATAPHICEGVTDIFERLLALTITTCTSVQTQVLPVLQTIFLQNQVQQAVSGTIGAALDLLKSVLLSVEKHTRAMKAAQGASTVVAPSAAGPSAAPELLHPLLFSSLLPLTLTLVLHTDDHDLITVGTTVLTAFLRIDSAQVGSLSVPTVLPGSPAGTAPTAMTGLQLLCTIINQFLNPALDDRVAHNVGNLIVQVVFSLGSVLGEPNIKQLISAVVARLHASHYPPLDESLLMIFARLIHSSGVESILGFLLSLGRIPVQEKKLVPVKKNVTDKYSSSFSTELVATTVEALPYLLTKWVEAQTEIHAKYPSKILNLALTQLLTYLFSSAAGVEALRNMECQGYVVKIAPTKASKRVTRSATASSSSSHEPEYTKIPLCTKLLKMFISEWREWNEKHQAELARKAKHLKKLAKQAEGGDDDDEDDDDFDSDDYDDFEDDDDDDDDFIAQMQGKMAGAKASPFAAAEDFEDFGGAKSKGNASKFMTLSDMLDHHAGDMDEMDDELEEDVFPESLTDPLNQTQLGPFLQTYVQGLAQANGGAYLQEAARWLDDKDQKVLQLLTQSPPTA